MKGKIVKVAGLNKHQRVLDTVMVMQLKEDSERNLHSCVVTGYLIENIETGYVQTVSAYYIEEIIK